MAKGESVELLVNYKEHYEPMRERRGYGKANLNDGVKSDADNITRVQRNLKERPLVEQTILQFNEEQIHQVMDFIHRTKGGIQASISSAAGRDGHENKVIVRQYVALRRIDFVSRILQTRLHELLGQDSSFNEESMFENGMFVYVNDWPQNDIRPPYTGLANVIKVSKDVRTNQTMLDVEVPEGKYICEVPEAGEFPVAFVVLNIKGICSSSKIGNFQF